jgi:hypothetical protein
MAASGVWIVNTAPDKPDQSTRKLIRRHVMRGKNTRAARRAKDPLQYSEWVTRAHGQPSLLGAEEGWVLSTPRKIASELALFGFPIVLKPYMVELLYRGRSPFVRVISLWCEHASELSVSVYYH